MSKKDRLSFKIIGKKIENCIKPVERCLILLQNNCLDLSMKVMMLFTFVYCFKICMSQSKKLM